MASLRTSGSAFTTASGTKTVTLTPAVGDLVVIIAANTGNTATATISDNNPTSSTYATITTCLKNTSADLMSLHVRNALMANTTSTIYSMAPGTTTGGGLIVLLVSGMWRTGSTAVRSSGVQANQALGGTPAPALGGAALDTSFLTTAVFNGTNGPNLTVPGGFTRDFDLGYNSPASGLDEGHDDSGQTATTYTWGTASATAFCSLVAELDARIQFDNDEPGAMFMAQLLNPYDITIVGGG